MKYRDLEKLTQVEKFTLFTLKNGLNVEVKEGQLFVRGSCMLMHIYSFVIESTVYWEFYIESGNRYSNIDRLLAEKKVKDKALLAFNSYKQSHVVNITPLASPSNLNNTLRVEQLFFTYVDVADMYLKDILNCDFANYEHRFSKTEESRMQTIRPYL